MFRKGITLLVTAVVCLTLALAPMEASAQKNSNSAKGQMKESGKEVGRAGKSLGHNVRHGRLIRGGKGFGKHMGRSGRHFGKGTKRAAHHVVSTNKNGK
ncbi:MAG TPA: hypothetical protein VLZ81_06035 [Blastocatellia bacterium]|nr:hypothetical protein [Blastocatellia bacterium]